MFHSRPWLLLSLLIGVTTGSVTYWKAGGEALLKPGTVSDRITSITWKHGADIAVEWYGGDTDAYREFRGRCKLDRSTGALTIINLTLKDSGVYTPEINNKVLSPTEITVISAVPKPTVFTQCSSEGTSCTFTCEGNITGAGAVTYSWVVDDKNMTGSSKSLEINKDDPGMVGSSLISCQLKNPVSSERSDDVPIPFTNSSSLGVIIGAIAFVIAIAVAVALVIWCKRRRGGSTFNEETSARPQAETSRHAHEIADEKRPMIISTSNGTVAYTKVNETHNEEQNSVSTQAKDEAEPSGRREETSGETKDGAEERTPFISTSNGTVTRSDLQEVSNQNSPDTVPTDDTEPSGRREETSGETEDGADETAQSSSEIINESRPDNTSAEDGHPSSEPDTSIGESDEEGTQEEQDNEDEDNTTDD